jgi:long-chain acyl-CoA synthetase
MLHVDLIAPIAMLLDRHAKRRPEQVVYWDSLRSVTCAQLAERTASIAANLAGAGLREGDKIAIYLPNGVDWSRPALLHCAPARSWFLSALTRRKARSVIA